MSPEPRREKGTIVRISGPVVTAEGIRPRMYDVVQVGEERLMGEVIKLIGERTVIQVYEETSGLRPGEPVYNTGQGLTVELGPGLMGTIYDGVQRPLPSLAGQAGDFISRGLTAPALDRQKKWAFVPRVKPGDTVGPGQLLGTVPETVPIEHRVLVPPDAPARKVTAIAGGEFTVEEPVGAYEDGTKIWLRQYWPVRAGRPVREKLPPKLPLLTGQRIFDGLFPIAKGGTAAIPGPFGSGKTVSQHQLAKWSDAQIVVYVGCGERGNEMTEVLTEFPELTDPKTGRPLMERTVLIANTSNMPVAAREASVYTGVTIAEYYRDQGYDVALMADSTSRWAEALREISSRLEEMPGEEGYPAYLSARLSAFYERAGRAKTLGGAEGSVSVCGAVSPPGGDFSEPVTQNTLRIVKVFWALDAKLAHRRHFPSINWLTSYSLYTDELKEWFRENAGPEWEALRRWTSATLQEEAGLQEIVQLVGSDSLPDQQQLTLAVARLLREVFLQQNAFHPVDSFCDLKRQLLLLQGCKRYEQWCHEALKKGLAVREILSVEARNRLAQARLEEKPHSAISAAIAKIEADFANLSAK